MVHSGHIIINGKQVKITIFENYSKGGQKGYDSMTRKIRLRKNGKLGELETDINTIVDIDDSKRDRLLRGDMVCV